MSSLEILIVSILVATTSCLIVIPHLMVRILKPVAIVLILLSCLQLIIHGCSWRYLPGYVLILAIIACALAQKRIIRLALVILLPIALLPWSIFSPVPVLPQPIGSYSLGTKIFRWVDNSRHEEITPDTLDKRNVIIQAWYPTEQVRKENHSAYLDGLSNLPEKVGAFPNMIFDRYDQIDTHATLDAPISTTKNQWPVVIFLTGNGASRAFYTSLVTNIASLGYVVLAIDHPYEAMLTELADGSVVTNVERYSASEPNLLKFMARRQQTRISDVHFVIDQLTGQIRPGNFFSHLDISSIAITGHSLGGATGAMAMAFDPRIKASVNIDGTSYGELPETKSHRPFLLIESRKDDGDFLRYESGNQKLFDHFGGGLRYELSEADHFSFTDAPLLLTSPARSLVQYFFRIGRAPHQTYQSTAVIITVFFSNTLQSAHVDIDSVAGSYKNIIKKSM
jgi:predicted dienelactone hydrolase